MQLVKPPLLVKPVEGQEFALAFGEKVVVAPDADAAVSAWRRAHEHGFDTIVQDAVALKYTTTPLTQAQLSELIQIPPR